MYRKIATEATAMGEAMDPLNVFNPGVGGMSVAPRYGRGGGDKWWQINEKRTRLVKN